jgi:hypothetical protein
VAFYWIVTYTSLMLNCFTHSIFVSKYWQIAQTQTNHCLSNFLFYGQFVLIVSCTITATTIKVLPIVLHEPKLSLAWAWVRSVCASLPPLLILIVLGDALRRLAHKESQISYVKMLLLLISFVLFVAFVILIQVFSNNLFYFFGYTLLNFLSILMLAIILLNIADLQIKY